MKIFQKIFQYKLIIINLLTVAVCFAEAATITGATDILIKR